MTEKLARRRVTVPGDYRPDVMATTRVGEIMTTDVVDRCRRRRPSTTPASASSPVATAPARVVDDDGRCVGIVTRSDLLALLDDADAVTVGDVFGGDVVVGHRRRHRARRRCSVMLDEAVDHLPGPRRRAARRDLHAAPTCCAPAARVAAAERPEPGWLARPPRRRGLIRTRVTVRASCW